MSQFVSLDTMHVYELGGTLVYQLLCGRDLEGSMDNYIYFVVNTQDMTAIVVDAAWDVEAIFEFASKLKVKIVGAIYTHFHADHAGGFGVAGCHEMQELGCPIWGGSEDAEAIKWQCQLPTGVLQELKDGEIVWLGSLALHILHTPGHTPGSICLFLSGHSSGCLTPRDEACPPSSKEVRVPVQGGLLISGDTLFVGGAGRTDLPGSDHVTLLRSLLRLMELDPSVLVVPGHNYHPVAYTTVNFEKGGNCTVQTAIDLKLDFSRVPPCCRCLRDGQALGPLGLHPGQRVWLAHDFDDFLGTWGSLARGDEGDDSNKATGGSGHREVPNEADEDPVIAIVEDYTAPTYAVRPLGITTKRRAGVARRRCLITAPELMLKRPGKALGQGDQDGQLASLEAAKRREVVFYRVVHGQFFRKEDPVSSGAWGAKVAASKKAIGTLIKTTGKTFTGAQGTTWVELMRKDSSQGPSAGWAALHGRCFGVDAELLKLVENPSEKLQEDSKS